MSFAEEMSRFDGSRVSELIHSMSSADVRRALGTQRKTFRDLAALLSPAAEEMLDEIAAQAQADTLRHFGRAVQLYSPLYLSNECDNDCAYCGFSAANSALRSTLSDEEIVTEARALRAKGFHHILLLTGEAPRAIDKDRLAEVVRLLRPLFASISIEVFPMNENGYKTMVASGVDGLVIYQETYDKNTYLELHRSGRKRDYAFRLDAPEAGAAAGMRRVGIGCLLGLSDFRRDMFFTALHAAYLTRNFWRTQVTVSFPRIRQARSDYSPKYPVSDRQLALSICAMRLFLPRAGLLLSTRENPRLRDALLPIGITQMSAGSCTQPGGYASAKDNASQSQFEVNDDRSAEEVFAAIRSLGYDPAWKDWDAELSGGAR